jgi:hypothetical protein
MVRHSTTTASRCSVLLAALLFSLALAGVAAAQDTTNTSLGIGALENNTTGRANIAIGFVALAANTTGEANTASGLGASTSTGNLTNATAIGAGAIVNASNKIRLGNAEVTVIEGHVAFTSVSDKTKKENFQPVDGEAVLEKIRGLALSSWGLQALLEVDIRLATTDYLSNGYDGL